MHSSEAKIKKFLSGWVFHVQKREAPGLVPAPRDEVEAGILYMAE
jgi:hypothetical protein